jgi:hypothetical protein
MMQPMPRVPPFDRPATYEDLVKLPDNFVAEILGGELHASPRPTLWHSRAELSLGRAIAGPYDDGVGGPGGWWILVEPELHLGPDVLVPDLAGWRRTHMPKLPAAAHAGDEVVRAEPFVEIDLELALVWTDPPSPA